uniref:Uncharacterized protein n=1 Tax=Arundo donax TaxID=35708 RepID=A0A0A9S4M9_ARUDO
MRRSQRCRLSRRRL